MKRAGLLVGLVLIVAVAWWLVESGRGEGEVAVVAPVEGGQAAVAEAVELPPAEGLVVEEGDEGLVEGVESEGGATEKPAVVGVSATFSGRVVDHYDVPVVGATVVFMPSDSTLQEMGIPWEAHGAAMDDLPRTMTDSEGWFTIAGFHVERGHWIGDEAELFPKLVVINPPLAIVAHACMGYRGGPYDAGVIRTEPGAAVVGRAVDDGGRPIAGADVHVTYVSVVPKHVPIEKTWHMGDAIRRIASTVSGGDGRFRTGHLWNGRAWIRITAPGRQHAWLSEQEIDAPSSLDLGDVVLSQAGIVSGWVHDVSGDPVEDADVYVAKAYEDSKPLKLKGVDRVLLELGTLTYRSPHKSTTDAEGWFEIRGLELANYTVYVDAAGHEPVRLENVAPDRPPLRFVAQTQAILSLLVSDAAGEPVADARVRAWRNSGRMNNSDDPELDVEALEAGRFRILRVGHHQTDVLAMAEGHASITVDQPGVAPGETIERSVTLERESTVSGRVVDSDGNPIGGAVVSAKAKSRHLPKPDATTSEVGEYRIGGLGAGEWAIVADHDAFGEEGRLVTVEAGADLTGIDFELARSGSIHGTVYDGDGEPAVAWSYTARRLSPEGESIGSAQIRTDSDGSYELADLTPGRWRLDRDPLVEVDLLPGQRMRVDLHERRPILVHGRVRVDGRLSPHAAVFANPVGERGVSVSIANDAGEYELRLHRAGDYDVSAYSSSPPSGKTLPKQVSVVSGDDVVLNFDIAGVNVSGVVVDAVSGESVSGATVILTPASAPRHYLYVNHENKRLSFWPITGPDGAFSFDHANVGPAVGNCTADGFVRAHFDLKVPDQGVDGVEIQLARAAKLSGRVHYASGVPLPDSTVVRLKPESGDGDGGFDMLEGGRFGMGGLAPGAYRLQIGQHEVLAEQLVTLTAGQTLEVELIVTP